ncbi:MAG: hypothetical protein A3H42_02350 [Deltaproteobacteria bacterium RIFCSPLOWO2_02_FULL_46_8]|nr:MAG: hypothetical protein A3H42_02350 [Deltaproteobacteria bacterium RIFCSPLOWO2_02_FULL_46_8]
MWLHLIEIIKEMKISFREVCADNIQEVHEVYAVIRQAPQYFLNVAGLETVSFETALKEMKDQPSKHVPSYKKIFLLAMLDGKDIGVVDLHKDHPHVGKAYIGLLLIGEKLQKKGIGKAVYENLETWVKKNYEVEVFVLGVSIANNVEGFWTKMGFKKNGKTYLWGEKNKTTQVFEMEKFLF